MPKFPLPMCSFLVCCSSHYLVAAICLSLPFFWQKQCCTKLMRLGKKRATDTQRSDLVTIVLYGHLALFVYGVSSPWPGIWSCSSISSLWSCNDSSLCCLQLFCPVALCKKTGAVKKKFLVPVFFLRWNLCIVVHKK